MRTYISIAGLVLVAGFAAPAHADHAWGGYHWARTASPFTLTVVDSVAPVWDGYLDTAIADWAASDVLDLSKENGATGSNDRRRCKPIVGKIRVCSQAYGRNGWLGIASIWANGNHITQATTKVNDTYFGTAAYNTPAWKQMVMCQEIGHDFGLDHQDETFSNANLDTCMDYTSSPASNQHPNAHDYEELDLIYAHLDTLTTIAASTVQTAPADTGDEVTDDPATWGRETHRSADGRSSQYERTLQSGTKVITHVFWADTARSRDNRGER